MKKFFAFFLAVLIFTTNAFSKQTDDGFSFEEGTGSFANVEKEKQVPMVKVDVQEDETLTVPFMTHIPYFSIYVNVFSDEDVVVTEKLFLVLSEDQNAPFVRSYPLSYTDMQENKIQNKSQKKM